MSSLTSKNIQIKMTKVRAKFYKTERFERLENEFDRLYQKRNAELNLGLTNEARGLVLIGNSGSGKSTALKRLFGTHKNATVLREDIEKGDIASLSVPSPATHKFMGLATLHALGYPMQKDKTSAAMWAQVQQHMRLRQVKFLHFDEAQDFASTRPNERAAVVNTLKSIMQNPDWPVGLFLSGMPALLELVNEDAQLARRITPIHFQSLDLKSDLDLAFSVLQSYADSAQLQICEELKTQDFMRRLLHASALEFGVLIELVIAAIEGALIGNSESLSIKEFKEAFQSRSGVIDGLNPFVIEDYCQIDPRRVLGHVEVGGVL